MGCGILRQKNRRGGHRIGETSSVQTRDARFDPQFWGVFHRNVWKEKSVVTKDILSEMGKAIT